MTTDAGVLELIAVDVRLDFDPPCDFGHPEPCCDRTAVWIGVPSCCATPTLRCDEHRRSLDRMFRRYQDEGGRMRHRVEYGGCGNYTDRVRWEPLRAGGSDG